MEPLIFTFCFTIEGYNVFVTMEFFPHIDVMMAKSTINSLVVGVKLHLKSSSQ